MSKTFAATVFVVLVFIFFAVVMAGFSTLFGMVTAAFGLPGLVLVWLVAIFNSRLIANYLIVTPAAFITNGLSKAVGWIRGLFGKKAEGEAFATI